MAAAGPADPRDETEAQRNDRNLAELLQELRVAGLGVQVLFGFLLSLPFTNRFSRLSQGQRDLYLAILVLDAVATYSPDRREVMLSVINRDPEHDVSTELQLAQAVAPVTVTTHGVPLAVHCLVSQSLSAAGSAEGSSVS